MLNIQNLLYKTIGDRIKNMMAQNGETLDTLEEKTGINKSMLSKISNGKTNKRRNPYLLSDTNIELLAEHFGIEETELIWGTETEIEAFVKIIIIAILMNSDKLNPFEHIKNEDFDKWIENENNTNSEKSYFEVDVSPYKYFINLENAESYDKLENKFSSDLEDLSNKSLKILLQFDYHYAQYFINKILNRLPVPDIEIRHLEIPPSLSSKINKGWEDTFGKITYNNTHDLISQFLFRNKGEYNIQILDNKGEHYKLFMIAFYKYWESCKDIYIDFFKKNIFSIFSSTEKGKMKKLQNTFFHTVISSEDFNILTTSLIASNRYSNIDNMFISNMFEMKLLFELYQNTMTDAQWFQYKELNKYQNFFSDIFNNH